MLRYVPEIRQLAGVGQEWVGVIGCKADLMHCERFDGPDVKFVAQSKSRDMGYAVLIHWRVCREPPWMKGSTRMSHIR